MSHKRDLNFVTDGAPSGEKPVLTGKWRPGCAKAGYSGGLVAAGLLRKLQMPLRFLDQHRRFVFAPGTAALTPTSR